ncbi:hypothetical protein E4U22_004019 [Claviceps purpurea]|nr:hypothetical protein E4U22_004019 [Claviceps purpurea]
MNRTEWLWLENMFADLLVYASPGSCNRQKVDGRRHREALIGIFIGVNLILAWGRHAQDARAADGATKLEIKGLRG